MNCSTDISQHAGFGARENTFIAEQHNHTGLSVTDATQIAFSLFHEYYPQLREEALKEVHQLVTQELERIPPENIIAPSPRIVLPTLQGASVSEERELREIYAKLLASSMDSKKADKVHPSFPRLLDQLSADDARLLKKITEINNSIPVATIRFTLGDKFLQNAMPHYYSPYFDDLNNNWQTSMGIENLYRLQLINLFEGTVNSYDYKQFETFPFVTDQFNLACQANPTRQLKIEVSNFVIQRNDFGKEFATVCIPK